MTIIIIMALLIFYLNPLFISRENINKSDRRLVRRVDRTGKGRKKS